MTDLTVLISPMPLYPTTTKFTFGRRASRTVSHPMPMVTLERASDTELEAEADGHVNENDRRRDPSVELVEAQSSRSSTSSNPSTPASPPRRSRSPTPRHQGLLSPPLNTWKSPTFALEQEEQAHRQPRNERQSRPRPQHRSIRSRSAPPAKIDLDLERETATQSEHQSALLRSSRQEKRNSIASVLQPSYDSIPRLQARRPSAGGIGYNTLRGEPIRPPPPLFRPTTFWRKTSRSGVTAASFSPSSHLIRRSTFIAAGLSFDAPIHDLSAFGVETRVGSIVVPPESILQ